MVSGSEGKSEPGTSARQPCAAYKKEDQRRLKLRRVHRITFDGTDLNGDFSASKSSPLSIAAVSAEYLSILRLIPAFVTSMKYARRSRSHTNFCIRPKSVLCLRLAGARRCRERRVPDHPYPKNWHIRRGVGDTLEQHHLGCTRLLPSSPRIHVGDEGRACLRCSVR
jgi:hypothetical protein